jgi:hypothetical protein
MKHLQYTFEIYKILETYICNIGEGEARADRFRSSGWEPAASYGARAPPAPVILVGALGSVERPEAPQHMRPAVIGRAAACATAWERVARVRRAIGGSEAKEEQVGYAMGGSEERATWDGARDGGRRQQRGGVGRGVSGRADTRTTTLSINKRCCSMLGNLAVQSLGRSLTLPLNQLST